MTPAPLSAVRITAVIIREHSSSVVLLSHSDGDDTEALRSWLWDTPRLDVVSRGRALGRRFELTIDGVRVKASKVFAKMAQRSPGMVLVVTAKTPTEFLPLFGYHVRRTVHDVRLVRVEVDKQQAALPVAGDGERKRVTVEVAT
jgi:hypothetical protein